MKRQLRWDRDAHATLEVGKTYWGFILEINSKHTGFLKNTKPFAILLTKQDNSFYVNTGHPEFWNWTNWNWEVVDCKKYITPNSPNADLYFNGYICDSQEEAIREYNEKVRVHANQVAASLSYKYSQLYKDEVKMRILKNLIKEK